MEIGFPAGAAPEVDAERAPPSAWQAWLQSPACLLATLACAAIALGRMLNWPTPALALCAIAAVSLVGGPILVNATRALRLRQLDMFVLITLAVSGALLTGEWFEAATVIVLFRLALMIEQTSHRRTQRAIHDLLRLAPQRRTSLDRRLVGACR